MIPYDPLLSLPWCAFSSLVSHFILSHDNFYTRIAWWLKWCLENFHVRNGHKGMAIYLQMVGQWQKMAAFFICCFTKAGIIRNIRNWCCFSQMFIMSKMLVKKSFVIPIVFALYELLKRHMLKASFLLFMSLRVK